ncbi:MAG TPA: bifunctional tetrahydrofolate synthase/dihydrofolate synthase [Steroidobacteraceae bacterium]|nr:bifunctional tetrahydrofolate synthase/dihydrofolate synthase [Steroidobacteraceae bacterium]
MRFHTLEDWLRWQETLHPSTIDLGLERVKQVAVDLGLAPFQCPVVTVGGTNGKGSCVALLEAMLTAGGYRVGTFTSPHLVQYNERIRIAGRLATDEELMESFARIEAVRGERSLTFFEFNTLAALLLFEGSSLDAVLLEVGLGGRLDAVNIVDADVALLTSVALDHCEWLGNTVEEIGREKAGIFRAGRPAALGNAVMPRSVFAAAHELGTPLRIPGVDFSFRTQDERWEWADRETQFRDLPLPALAGRQQPANAAAAIAVLQDLRDRLPLDRGAIARGLREVRLRGRFEVLGGDPEWILDVAHNAEAAAALADNLRARAPSGRTLAVVGILKDKDAPALIAPLLPLVDHWIAASTTGPRGQSAAELRKRCAPRLDRHCSEAASVAEGCESARAEAQAGDRIVVYGSFQTVGPALEWLEHSLRPSAILARRGR